MNVLVGDGRGIVLRHKQDHVGFVAKDDWVLHQQKQDNNDMSDKIVSTIVSLIKLFQVSRKACTLLEASVSNRLTKRLLLDK